MVGSNNDIGIDIDMGTVGDGVVTGTYPDACAVATPFGMDGGDD